MATKRCAGSRSKKMKIIYTTLNNSEEARKIGNYSHCSYSVDGVGRYKPLEGAKPHMGEVGKFEEVEEERIECVCERSKAKEIIAAIRKVRPYEEVAFDIYPLISEEEL